MFLLRVLLIGLSGVVFLGCNKPQPPGAVRRSAPPWKEGLTWVNQTGQHHSDFRGKVTVLVFFDTSSARSIRMFPYLKAWQERYAAHHLVVIGILSAEYDFSSNPILVNSAVRRHALTFPVATDGEYAMSRAYGVQGVPHLFVIDQKGAIRYDEAGGKNCTGAERVIQQLLREREPKLKLPSVLGADKEGVATYPVTPELFLGRSRGQPVNCDARSTNAVVSFTLPAQREEGRVYAAGPWSLLSSSLRHAEDSDEMNDCVVVKYRAVGVDAVMRPEGVYWKQVFVQQDGKWLERDYAGKDIVFDEQGRSQVEVRSACLYNLVAGQPYGIHELRLISQGKGLSVYSFSFGTSVISKGGQRLE